MEVPKLFRCPLPLAIVLLFLAVAPALAQKKEIIQLQRDVAILQEVVRQVERQTGERFAVLENLLNQNLEASNKLNAAIALIERTQSQQTKEVVAPVASTNTKVDALQSQMSALRDAVEEVSARLMKVQQQVEDVKNQVTTMPPPSMGIDDGQGASAAPGVTSAETIFNSAFSDYTRGNYQLARQQFQDYLKFYGNTVRAAEAQYYLGAVAYEDGDYTESVKHFDLVLERYPLGVVSADAQYKKGMSLLKLNRPEDAVREFQSVLERFPNSSVAANARGQLDQLQGGSSLKPSPTRRSSR